MKIGVIADSHDNLDAVRYLVELFETRGVDQIIHAGDFIAPFVIPELAEFSGPVHGVFGNNDGDRQTLRSQAEGTQVNVVPPPLNLEVAGCDVEVTHTPEQLSKSGSRSGADLVVHGHTHRPDLEPGPESLRVNPGEAGGWLTGTTHFALVDMSDLEVELEAVPAP